MLQTAVPALAANGSSALDLLGTNVAFFVVVSRRLADAVPEDARADAGLPRLPHRRGAERAVSRLRELGGGDG